MAAAPLRPAVGPAGAAVHDQQPQPAPDRRASPRHLGQRRRWPAAMRRRCGASLGTAPRRHCPTHRPRPRWCHNTSQHVVALGTPGHDINDSITQISSPVVGAPIPLPRHRLADDFGRRQWVLDRGVVHLRRSNSTVPPPQPSLHDFIRTITTAMPGAPTRTGGTNLTPYTPCAASRRRTRCVTGRVPSAAGSTSGRGPPEAAGLADGRGRRGPPATPPDRGGTRRSGRGRCHRAG